MKDKKGSEDLITLSIISDKTSGITYSRNKNRIKFIESQYNAWGDLAEVIKSRYSALEPVCILNFESVFNIESSTLLAINGYYKQAISVLRFWFENSLFSIYYQDHNVEFDWFSVDVMPSKHFRMSFTQDLLNYLFTFKNFSEFNQNYSDFYKKGKKRTIRNFRQWIEILYDELSAYIHGRGYHRSNLVSSRFYRGEIKYYNENNFAFWCDLFNNVGQTLVISLLLYNPKLLNRHIKKKRNILNCLHPDMVTLLNRTISIKI